MKIETLSKAELNKDVPKVAKYCADEIKKKGEIRHGGKPNRLQVHNAAVDMLLKLIDVQEAIKNGPQDEETAYDLYQNMEQLATELPVAMIHAGTSETMRNRRAVHEMATHLQRTRVASDMYDADLVVCEGMNGTRVRHHIARQVEEMLFDDGDHAE